MGEDGDPDIKARVATNPSTPHETLDRLSRDHDFIVRMSVASNPQTPTTTLFRLLKEGGPVQKIVASNPNFTLDNYIDEFIELGEDL